MSYPDKKHKETARKILALLKSPIFKTASLIFKPSFVICGTSGCGKTTAIKLANRQLPEDEQIAESSDILFCLDARSAEQIISQDDSRYLGTRYIAYSTVRKTVGQDLAKSALYGVIFVE